MKNRLCTLKTDLCIVKIALCRCKIDLCRGEIELCGLKIELCRGEIDPCRRADAARRDGIGWHRLKIYGAASGGRPRAGEPDGAPLSVGDDVADEDVVAREGQGGKLRAVGQGRTFGRRAVVTEAHA